MTAVNNTLIYSILLLFYIVDVQQRTGTTVPDPVAGHNSLSLNHSVDVQTDHNPCYAVATEEAQLVPNPSYASTVIQQ